MPAPGPYRMERGDLEDLYRRFGPLVLRRARSILGDDTEAHDAMQEVFVRVITALGEFRGLAQPSTWLYRITTNLCLNRIRDSKRRRERLKEIAVARGEAPRAGEAREPELTATVQALLARLPAELGQVAVYYYIDEMDQDEIAGILGVSRRTVGYRLDRFRAEARAILEAA